MTQTREVRGRSTAIFTEDGWTKVIYHSTPVVSFSHDKVRLRDGGWPTVTTKLRMNQAANQFGLGYSVWQRNYDWYITLRDGRQLPYVDGMEFSRP